MMKKLLLSILIFLCCLTSKAQEVTSDTLDIYFHQGSSKWVADYKENGQRLEKFVNRFKELRKDEVMRRISKIHIIAGCSPEGTYSYNQRLSKNRVLSIRNVLNGYITLPDSIVVEKAIGINWQGLRTLVEEDLDVPYRERVLEIIDNTPELAINYLGKEVELRKQRLIWLHGGKAWQYMYEKLFPTLRSFNLQIAIEWDMYDAVVQEVIKPARGG